MSRVPYFPHGISSRVRPLASIAETNAIGNPVALLASADGTGGTGIDLDHDDSSALGIMGKLYIGSADDLNLLHDLIRLPLKLFLDILRNRQP